jgi:hypothetical protein
MSAPLEPARWNHNNHYHAYGGTRRTAASELPGAHYRQHLA